MGQVATKEFWRWKEYNWHDENKDWKGAATITGGVDVGSVSSQAVIMVGRRAVRILEYAHRIRQPRQRPQCHELGAGRYRHDP
jgi:hypothetical protein